MAWWLWLLIGSFVGVCVLLLLVYLAQMADTRHSRKLWAVRAQSNQAEQHMQAIVQNTIENLFRQVRGPR